jgi:integrase
MKAQRAHQVPLSTQALALLRGRLGLHESLLFPSPRGIIPCDMVLTSFLRRVRAPSTTAGRVATAHGFRSTLRDWCSVHGVRHDIAERLLAHEIGSAVEVAYHREPLLDERREVLQNWADYVLSEVK